MTDRSSPEDDLKRILHKGAWKFRPEEVPALASLAERTFGDPPAALRARLRRSFQVLGDHYEEAGRRLFGVTEETAALPLGQRREQAGQSNDLPKTQAPSTVRGPRGLERHVLQRLLDYFEHGDSSDTSRPSEDGGKGYHATGYEVLYSQPSRTDDPMLWKAEVRLTVKAYMNDIDLVEGTIHRRGSHSERLEVTSPGHHLVGTVPMRPSQANSPQRIVIYVESPLNRGDSATVEFWHHFRHDRVDSVDSYGVNVASYPAHIRVAVALPMSISEYVRLHQVDQPAGRTTLHEEHVLRIDDAPIEYEVPRAKPHTRYAVKWQHG